MHLAPSTEITLLKQVLMVVRSDVGLVVTPGYSIVSRPNAKHTR